MSEEISLSRERMRRSAVLIFERNDHVALYWIKALRAVMTIERPIRWEAPSLGNNG